MSAVVATKESPAMAEWPVARSGSRPGRTSAGTAASPAAAVRTAARGSRCLAGRSPGSAVPAAMVSTSESEAAARTKGLGAAVGTRGLGVPRTARLPVGSRPATGTPGRDETVPAGEQAVVAAPATRCRTVAQWLCRRTLGEERTEKPTPELTEPGRRRPRGEGMAPAGLTVPKRAWPIPGPRKVAGSLQAKRPARARNPVAGGSHGPAY
jgi:hypothetical protein